MAIQIAEQDDDFSKIAQRFNVSVQDVVKANPRVNRVYPGSAVRVPEKRRQTGSYNPAPKPPTNTTSARGQNPSQNIDQKFFQRGSQNAPQPPPPPDRIGAGFSGAVPGGTPDFYLDEDFNARSYEDIAGVQEVTPITDAAGNLVGYNEAIPGSTFGRETDNPLVGLRNRLQSDPNFDLNTLNDFGVEGWFDVPEGRQQVGMPMRTVEDRMVTTFLDFVEDQREIYGDDWQYEIKDQTDANILEHLGLLEPTSGGGGGGYGGGYGGGGSYYPYSVPSRAIGTGRRPQTSRQSTFVQLTSWRI